MTNLFLFILVPIGIMVSVVYLYYFIISIIFFIISIIFGIVDFGVSCFGKNKGGNK